MSSVSAAWKSEGGNESCREQVVLILARNKEKEKDVVLIPTRE